MEGMIDGGNGVVEEVREGRRSRSRSRSRMIGNGNLIQELPRLQFLRRLHYNFYDGHLLLLFSFCFAFPLSTLFYSRVLKSFYFSSKRKNL